MKRILMGVVLLLAATVAAAADPPQVVVFNWSEYMPEEVLRAFETETGIRVVYSTYESNEAMYAKVKLLDAGGYDVVFPSTYFVNRMRQENLLLPIDKTRLSNWRHLDPTLLDKPYDPGNVYSVPYMWGTTALGVDASRVDPATIRSWRDLWRPEFSGRVMLSEDLREVFAIGLRLLGYSGNTRDPDQIAAAYAQLQPLIPSIRLFASDAQKQAFLNQEVVIGMIWNGEAFMAAQENPNIRYIYPQEGPIVWLDSMVIPKNAANPDQAHRFIDFVHRPEIARMISEEIGYASPNRAAVALLDEAVRHNPTVYPPQQILDKGEFQLDVGEAMLIYEKYWEQLKSGR
jgi:spermidine/putrescine transport system substrate-binding protein